MVSIGISTAGPTLAPEVRRSRGDVKRERYFETGEGKDGQAVITAQGERDRVNNMIRRYWKRHEITHQQFLAGERLARTAELVSADVRSQLDLEGKTGGGGNNHDLAALAKGGASHDARLMCIAALNRIGPELAPVVAAVCIWGRSATSWAEERKKPRTDGIALLRAGLDALAAHWASLKSWRKPMIVEDDDFITVGSMRLAAARRMEDLRELVPGLVVGEDAGADGVCVVVQNPETKRAIIVFQLPAKGREQVLLAPENVAHAAAYLNGEVDKL